MAHAGGGDASSADPSVATGWEGSVEEEGGPPLPGAGLGLFGAYSPVQGPPRGMMRPAGTPPSTPPGEGIPWPRTPATGETPWNALRSNMDAKMAELRAEKAEAAARALEEMSALRERVGQAESARDMLAAKLEAARDKMGTLGQQHASRMEVMEMAKQATDRELDAARREVAALRSKLAVAERDHDALERARAEIERLKMQIAQEPGTIAANESYIDAITRIAELEDALADAKISEERESEEREASHRTSGRADSPGMRAQLAGLVQEAEAAAERAVELGARLKASESATLSLREELRQSQEAGEALSAEVEALRRAAQGPHRPGGPPKTPGPVRDAYRAENEALLAENAAVKDEIEAVRAENKVLRESVAQREAEARSVNSASAGAGSPPVEGEDAGGAGGVELLERELQASSEAIEAARAENALLRQALQRAEARIPSPAAAAAAAAAAALEKPATSADAQDGSVQVMEQQLMASSKVIEALMTENIDMMATLNKQSNQLALLKAQLDDVQPDAPRLRSSAIREPPSSSDADVLGGDFVDDYGRHPARRGVVSIAVEGSDDEEEALPSPAVFRGQSQGAGVLPGGQAAGAAAAAAAVVPLASASGSGMATPPRGIPDQGDDGEPPADAKPRRRGPLTFLYGYIAGDDKTQKARMEV